MIPAPRKRLCIYSQHRLRNCLAGTGIRQATGKRGVVFKKQALGQNFLALSARERKPRIQVISWLTNEMGSSDSGRANDGCPYSLLRAQSVVGEPLGWGPPAPRPKESGSAGEFSALPSPRAPCARRRPVSHVPEGPLVRLISSSVTK